MVSSSIQENALISVGIVHKPLVILLADGWQVSHKRHHTSYLEAAPREVREKVLKSDFTVISGRCLQSSHVSLCLVTEFDLFSSPSLKKHHEILERSTLLALILLCVRLLREFLPIIVRKGGREFSRLIYSSYEAKEKKHALACHCNSLGGGGVGKGDLAGVGSPFPIGSGDTFGRGLLLCRECNSRQF